MTAPPESTEQTPFAMVPIPSPIATAGLAAVRLAVTSPLDNFTTNGCESDPPTGTVPVKVSLVGGSAGVDGVVGAPPDDPPEHAAHASSATPARKRFIATFRNLKDGRRRRTSAQHQGCHKIVRVFRQIFGWLWASRAEGARRPPRHGDVPRLFLQRDLLRAPIPDLADPQIVLSPAVDGVDHSELFGHLAGLPELAHDLSAELHFVDLAVIHAL